jgi:hypothetical protein
VNVSQNRCFAFERLVRLFVHCTASLTTVRPSNGSLSALEAALSHHGPTGVWSFQPATERRLVAETGHGNRVLIFLAVAGSQAVQAGVAIKKPPKKTHPNKPQKNHLKKPIKNGFLGFFLIFNFL